MFDFLIVHKAHATEEYIQSLIDNADNPKIGVYSSDLQPVCSISFIAMIMFSNCKIELETFEKIINRVPDINAKMIYYGREYTVMHFVFAELTGDFSARMTQMIKILLDKGAIITEEAFKRCVNRNATPNFNVLFEAGYVFTEHQCIDFIIKSLAGPAQQELISKIITTNKLNVNVLLQQLVRTGINSYVPLLLSLGANPTVAGEDGVSPMQYVKDRRNNRMKKMFRCFSFPKMITIDDVANRVSIETDKTIKLETLGETGFSTRVVTFIETDTDLVIPSQDGTSFIHIPI